MTFKVLNDYFLNRIIAAKGSLLIGSIQKKVNSKSKSTVSATFL